MSQPTNQQPIPGGELQKKPQATKPGWSLTHDLIEVHWVKDLRGNLYADKVRIRGFTFYATVHGDIPQRKKRESK